MLASGFLIVEASRFINVCHGGRHKENGDVDPIGGSADDAVVGIEDYRN